METELRGGRPHMRLAAAAAARRSAWARPSLLARGVRTPWRILVGASGIVIGAWPLLAALEGEYASGPFTSRFWFGNAIVVALWYAAGALCAFRRGRVRSA